jgi:glycosyltransferase involved in cell wall biosynthesis
MKIALVYDRVTSWGGAERILEALHQIFPEASLYTSVYNKKKAAWANDFDVKTSFLQQSSFASNHHEMLALLMPVAFESFSFDDYDLVISITSEAAKGIITKPKTRHICYCLTPTRYLWSGYNTYFSNPLLKVLAAPAVRYLRKWDTIAAKRPDAFISISKEVQQRVKNYYDAESEIIYPPLMISKKQAAKGEPRQGRVSRSKKQEDGEYFLAVSRLSKYTKYKRIDLAIQSCNELELPLKIIGSGSWKEELQQMAGPTIEFLGAVSDESLAEYYRNCKALIFPAHEDFGLTVVEAQSYGRPVIAFGAGGALETVHEGTTGVFFKEQTKTSLVKVLRDFDEHAFSEKDCIDQASLFSFENFKKEFLSLVNRLD